jgi:hypothetical protein
VPGMGNQLQTLAIDTVAMFISRTAFALGPV